MCNRGGLIFNLGSVAVASSWAAGQHTAERGTDLVYAPWPPDPRIPNARVPNRYQIQYQAICSVRRIANCGASSCMMPALRKISRDARGARRVDVRVRIAGASARFVCDIHVECLRRI